MEVNSDSVILNSCELTPVYLIPTSGVAQAVPCIIAPSNQEVQKPVTDNLKRFYENVGNLENGFISSCKPRILKKQTSALGNNLKLASFLLPKSEPQSVPIKQLSVTSTDVPISTVIVQPTVTTVNTSVVNTIPTMEISRKIVRIGAIPATIRTQPRVLPKICRPKEETNASKHTSVQLLKLGETYHSLNQLSEEQMKIVNHALKMFSDSEKIPKEPAYDPVTNTKFIYKVVSPKDLTVVGKNKLLKHKKSIIKRQEAELENEEVRAPEQPKVTRSGRTVKLPKQMLPEETPQKPKKKNGSIHTCFQCAAEFSSLYRLQRHHENNPTHIPAKSHTNLFHCFLAIIKGGSEVDQANIFVQQLEQLVQKIRNLLPCLMKTVEGKEGRLCTINEDIGRLFGLDPGKYSLNMDALVCVKNKEGHCVHNPDPMKTLLDPDMSKLSQKLLTKHNDEMAQTEAEAEDCARIHPVDKWPTVSKRIWKLKEQKTQMNAKRIRLVSENDQFIELGTDDLMSFSKTNEENATTALQKIASPADNYKDNKDDSGEQKYSSNENQNKPKGDHVKFHSTHFDIRSSPIKLSGHMRKFKLDPDKLPAFEVQIMRPLTNNKEQNDIVIESNNDNALDLQDILRENGITKADLNTEFNFNKTKSMSWHISPEEANVSQSNDSFMKGDLLFDAALTPMKDVNLIEPSLLHIEDKSSDLLETPVKSVSLDEAAVSMYSQTKSNNAFEQSLLNLKTKSNSLFGPDIQVSSESNIKGSTLTSSSLIYVKAESRSISEPTMIHTTEDPIINSEMFNTTSCYIKPEPNGSLDHRLIHQKDSYKTSLHLKDKSDFESALSHVMGNSHSLFEPKKDSLIGPSLISINNKIVTGLPIAKDDNFAVVEMKDKSSFTEPSLLDLKVGKSLNMDVNNSDCLNNSDSSQGQSVLNFFESLGNELAYPETEIRNTSADFHLDLFSFSSS